MDTTVLLFLAPGFEEIEALGTVDILRRGGLHVRMVSVTDQLAVTGKNGVTVFADELFSPEACAAAEAFVLPGGGVMLLDYPAFMDQVALKHAQGKLVAAICAAPAVLGVLGLLQGRRATCYPGIEGYLQGAEVDFQPVVQDGNIITGYGPGWVYDFGLAVLAYLKDKETAAAIAQDMLLTYKG